MQAGDDADAAWWSQLAEVRDYVAEHDRLPRATTPLGKWLSEQRHAYPAGLSDEQAQALRSEPWWRGAASRDRHWEKQLQAVTDFYSTHGILPTGKASHWISNQVSEARAGNLSPSRIRMLEEQPWWEERSAVRGGGGRKVATPLGADRQIAMPDRMAPTSPEPEVTTVLLGEHGSVTIRIAVEWSSLADDAAAQLRAAVRAIVLLGEEQ